MWMQTCGRKIADDTECGWRNKDKLQKTNCGWQNAEGKLQMTLNADGKMRTNCGRQITDGKMRKEHCG